MSTPRGHADAAGPSKNRVARADLVLIALLLVLGTLAFVGTDIAVPQDMGLYMNRATQLAAGRGYVDMDGSPVYTRPPGFVGLLGASYALLGRSVGSGFWVVRLIAVLNPILVFALGRRLFNRRVGFMAALLFLGSVPILHASDRHLDHVWPALILLQLLALHVAWSTRKYRWLLLSGLFVGLAAWIKETALLCALTPLGVLFLRERPRWRDALLGIGTAWGSALIVFAPWAIWVLRGAGLHELLGIGATRAMGMSASSSGGAGRGILGMVRDYVVGLAKYFLNLGQSNSYVRRFPIAPVHYAAWIGALWRAFRRSPPAILILAALISYSPVLAMTGMQDMRVGQGILFFMLTALVVAQAVDRTSAWLRSRLRRGSDESSLSESITRAGLVSLLLIAQLGIGVIFRDPSFEFVLRSGAYKAVTGRLSSAQVVGVLYGPGPNRDAANWITTGLEEGTTLAMARAVEAQPVFFFSGGHAPVVLLPEIESSLDRRLREAPTHVISLASYASGLDPKNRFFALREDEAMETLAEEGVDYVLVGMQRNYLGLYFSTHPGFEWVKDFGGGQVSVFRVLDASEHPSAQPLIDTLAVQYLAALEGSDPIGYRQALEGFFEPVLSWVESEVNAIRAGSLGRAVESWNTYELTKPEG